MKQAETNAVSQSIPNRAERNIRYKIIVIAWYLK
jgi:hypothetical protein